MELSQIVAEIDAEIQRLQQARTLLSGASGAATATPAAPKPAAKTAPAKAAGGKRKRNLSPEGRARIQEALRKRWDEHRKNKSK